MDEVEKKIEELQKDLIGLEQKMQGPDFWQDKEQAVKIQKQRSLLKQELELISKAKEKGQTLPVFLSGKYDRGSAILSIQAGAGGRDAEDWASLLLKMYQRYVQRRNWTFRTLSQSFGEGGGPEGRLGLKEASAQIKGKFAYGLLKGEKGVHRLVRLSPFSSKQLRHTSFAKVDVLPQIKEEDFSRIELKEEDLKIETFKSSGKGGQNVNKRQTAIRITHLPTGLTVSCQAERMQSQNRKIAMQILAAKLLNKQEKEKEKAMKEIGGRKVSVEFGRQMRSYVLHPYKLVKDHRTGVETSDVEGVLDGDLDKFIEAEISLC